MRNDNPFGLAPEEAIRWFREKGYALNFDWRDQWGEEHTKAFGVAKATQLDLLADIRTAVDKAIATGGTLGEFRKGLTPLLQERGWWGKQLQVDPQDGVEKEVQLGSPRRLRTIYETNLRQAMAAGRWERIKRTAERRPFLRYVALDDGRTRQEHLAWHNTILPWDHPWWKTHAPPNGWGCRCKLQQLSERDMQRFGYVVSTEAPAVKTVLYTNERTGQTTRVPEGIDPSFAYNPGESRGASVPYNPREIPLRDVQDWQTLGRPDSRAAQKDRPLAPPLLPRERTPEDRAFTDAAFDKEFGLSSPEAVGTVVDARGLPITVNRRFLDHLRGAHKAPGDKPDPGRTQYIPLIRQALEKPYEIWMVPFRRPDGSVVMRQRYIGMFGDRQELVVVQLGDDGGIAWTMVVSGNTNSQRKGYLLYSDRGLAP